MVKPSNVESFCRFYVRVEWEVLSLTHKEANKGCNVLWRHVHFENGDLFVCVCSGRTLTWKKWSSSLRLRLCSTRSSPSCRCWVSRMLPTWWTGWSWCRSAGTWYGDSVDPTIRFRTLLDRFQCHCLQKLWRVQYILFLLKLQSVTLSNGRNRGVNWNGSLEALTLFTRFPHLCLFLAYSSRPLKMQEKDARKDSLREMQHPRSSDYYYKL